MLEVGVTYPLARNGGNVTDMKVAFGPIRFPFGWFILIEGCPAQSPARNPWASNLTLENDPRKGRMDL